MSTLEIISDSQNKLLARRELLCTFKGGSGLITRQAAAEAVASRLGVDKESVKVVSLRGKSGLRDLQASVYVFTDNRVVKKQLPNYLLIRQLGKEERKKAREELKKAKAPAAAAAGAEPAKKE